MKNIYYLGVFDLNRNKHRVVLCDPLNTTPRQLSIKDIRTEDFERILLTRKLDLKHCYLNKVEIGYDHYQIKYRGVDLQHSHRNASFMVVSRITIETVPAGYTVIDNNGNLRLFSDSLIQSGIPFNTDCGDFYIRVNGCNYSFDYPNKGNIPTVAENISALGRLIFEETVE